jgi:hypothetical protein
MIETMDGRFRLITKPSPDELRRSAQDFKHPGQSERERGGSSLIWSLSQF